MSNVALPILYDQFYITNVVRLMIKNELCSIEIVYWNFVVLDDF